MYLHKKQIRQTHSEVVKEVLHRLHENNLYAKPEKCVFNTQKVDFLGITVSADGIGMQNNKVDAILDWPTPMKLKQLQSFLRLCNYYRRFINGFGQIARPLNDLTKKNIVMVGPGRSECRPGRLGMSTKGLAYRRDKSQERRLETRTSCVVNDRRLPQGLPEVDEG